MKSTRNEISVSLFDISLRSKFGDVSFDLFFSLLEDAPFHIWGHIWEEFRETG